MKRLYAILILILPLTGFVKTAAQIPNFDSGAPIQAGGSVVLLPNNYYSAPCIVDWNEDGKKDLLVGCFYDGYVYLFENGGSNGDPVFTSGTLLHADGSPISVPYG